MTHDLLDTPIPFDPDISSVAVEAITAVQAGQFPSVIDSSFITSVRSCRHKARLEYIEHWKPKSESIHLVAGKAFARGLEVARELFYDQGQPAATCLGAGIRELLIAYGSAQCPDDIAKSPTRMAGALEYYFDRYPLGQDPAPPMRLPSGKHAIEFSFLEPIDVLHPVTGEPILYAGRFDQVVDYAGGIFGEDDKTASSLGPKWAQQWDLRSQFTAYCWGAAKGGLELNGFLVRGISILKTKYENQQATTYRPQWMIDRWYETMCLDVEDMIREWRDDTFRMNLDNSCNEYGGCVFRQVCISEDPKPWLEIGFERRRWDPVTREETVL